MELPKSFELVEEDAVGAPVKDIKWYGKEDQTDFSEFNDKGQGEKVLIRLFEFKFRPDLEKLPTKEEILTPEYTNHLKNLLWGDGLRVVLEPRIHIDKEGCKIFVPCQAALGQTFLEEAKLLQEY